MAVKRMPIGLFVDQLEAALERKDGYIMASKGQNPKKWAKDSWWFTQYSGSQKEKALYWRENAARVWDCNGLAEGIYEEWNGVDINTKAKYNYSGWCGEKGSGMIPARKRAPGMAVFWGDKASSIHHVAYLYKPVNADNSAGDWYLIEARGVMHGVVKTKLHSREPNFWGAMDRYFDYGDADYVPVAPELGERILRNGMVGDDVTEMQNALIDLGYDLGPRGADGKFGSCTEDALKAFQQDSGLTVDGEFGEKSAAALKSATEKQPDPDKEIDGGTPENPALLTVRTGSWRIRTGPGTDYPTAGFVEGGDTLAPVSPGQWIPVLFNNEVRFISPAAIKEVN